MSLLNPDTFAITPLMEIIYDLIAVTVVLYFFGQRTPVTLDNSLVINDDPWLDLNHDNEIERYDVQPNCQVIDEPQLPAPVYYPLQTAIEKIVEQFTLHGTLEDVKESTDVKLENLTDEPTTPYSDADTKKRLSAIARDLKIPQYYKLSKRELIDILNNLGV